MKVIDVKPRSKGSVVHVQEGSGPVIEAWTPAEIATVETWGGVVPEAYDLQDRRDGKGKILVEKKRGGGGGGYRQTKEAFDLDRAGMARHQEIAEDKVDRREAMRQAIAGVTAAGYGFDEATWRSHGAPLADALYEWLRSSPAGGPPAEGRSMAPRAGEPTTERNAPSPRAGAGSGEVAEPASSEPQPAKPYPIDPAVCDHRTSAGRWVKWVTANVHDFSGVADGTGPTITPQLVCPKCGTPMLVAMEGTNADLGPA